jgi:hypothetical protein
MADGSLSHFKATLARKQERNQKRQARSDRKLMHNSFGSKTEFDFPKLSESELKKVKADSRAQIKLEKKKQLTKCLIVMSIISSILLYVILKFS